MKRHLLFIHGGGEDGYHADFRLKELLEKELEEGYEINYPKMPSDENAPDFGWLDKIAEEVSKLGDGIIGIGHSLGASMLMKYLSERNPSVSFAGIFLLAAPYWEGNQDWVQGLKLKAGFSDRLPKVPTFNFYHCKDDEEVSSNDLDKYKKHISNANFIELEKGGHQFEGQMGIIAEDIKRI